MQTLKRRERRAPNVAEMSSRRHAFATRMGFNVGVTNEGFGAAGDSGAQGTSRTGDGPGVFVFNRRKRRERRGELCENMHVLVC